MMAIDLGIEGIEGAVEIGRGGFGVVYRATETDLGRTVAIKVLLGDFDERARVRFDRERRAMGSLSGHANIVTVHRSGFTDAGHPFLLMEFLEGGSIADRLHTEGRLPWGDVVQLGVEIADALATAHRAGVLHRDVKPGNILLGRSGVAKLGDFGIARLHGAPETRSAVVTASVAHAPPEVIGGSRPDERADVYSLASTLFELAWGAPAFVDHTDESLVPMLSRIAMESPPDLAAVGMPAPIANVIFRAMAKEKTQRHASADAFGEALARARAEVEAGTGSTAAVDRAAAGMTNAISAPDPSGRAPSVVGARTPSAQRRSPLLLGLGVVVLAVLAAVAVALVRSGDDGATASPLRSTNTDVTVDATSSTPAVDEDPADQSPPTTPQETVQTAPETTDRTATTPTPSTPSTVSPIARTREVSSGNGAISVLVPASWDQQTSDATSLLVTTDLDAALADEWVKGTYLQAVRNTPDQNPGGFAPDVTLNQLIAESGCIVRERGPYSDASFGGSYALLDQCEDSGLSVYFLVAAPFDLSTVVLVGVIFESPTEDVVVQQILDSTTWNFGALP